MTLLRQQMLPFGVTFSDGTTKVLHAPSKPDAEDRAWELAYRLTQAQRGWRREIGVRSIEEIHPKEVSYWPDAPPAQIGNDDEPYELEKDGAA